jgi:hypothetical protein
MAEYQNLNSLNRNGTRKKSILSGRLFAGYDPVAKKTVDEAGLVK